MSFATGSMSAPEAPGIVNADLGHLEHDRHLTMKIMKKRQEEMARRQRLLDPRTRQFGVSHNVLDEQVAQKRVAQAAAAEEEADYTSHLAAQEHILQTIEGMKNQQQRERQKATIDYSMQNHHKETRREYKLSDPKEYTSSYLTHPEDQLGPCSMSKFEGEKVDEIKKKQMQQETAQWLKMQMQEKRDREQADKDFHRFHDTKMMEANNMRAHCEAATMQEMKEEKVAEAQENLGLAAARQMRDQAKTKRDFADKVQHAHSVTTSDGLTECHDYKVGSNGKLMKAEYKRLSIEEEQDVYNTNAHLVLERKAKQQAEAAEMAGEAAMSQFSVGVMGAVENEGRRQQRERTMKMVQENQQLAAAKRANDMKDRRAYLSFDYEA